MAETEKVEESECKHCFIWTQLAIVALMPDVEGPCPARDNSNGWRIR